MFSKLLRNTRRRYVYALQSSWLFFLDQLLLSRVETTQNELGTFTRIS